MRTSQLLPFATLALASTPFSALAAPQYSILIKEATAVLKTSDPTLIISKLETAARLRPDYPRLQLMLARQYATLKRQDDALIALQRLADMGVALPIADDPALASLKSLPRFQALAKQLAAPPTRVGNVTPTTIAGVTGILESVLIDDATGAWYFGDVRNRCIWRGDADGSLRKFTSDSDSLQGVFKLALSSDRKVLWASTATVPNMIGPRPEGSGRSDLVEIDFATGRVIARHRVRPDAHSHLLGDFIFAPDGSVFSTDSFSPIIWRLSADDRSPERWLESDEFLNLQGLAFSADGKTLYVADYSNGIWRIDVATKKQSLLTAPSNATFFGIDGLYAVGDSLLAIQNGVNPQRVLRIEPATDASPSVTRTLAIGHPAMTDLSLGVVHGDKFHFIADSGWALFDPVPATEPPARSVTVYSLPLE